MELGAFSLSLAVKDIAASREFYAKLGFEPIGGDEAQKWLILANGGAKIGLFEGMFESNILTFNPGWGDDQGVLEEFQDVRAIRAELKAQGVSCGGNATESESGPAHLTLVDPDGNTILIDQHV